MNRDCHRSLISLRSRSGGEGRLLSVNNRKALFFQDDNAFFGLLARDCFTLFHWLTLLVVAGSINVDARHVK